jgi:flagellar biosynthesis regulator FlaF
MENEFTTQDPDADYPDADLAIDSVLGENARSSELQELIDALAQRRRVILREAERTTNAQERIRLEARLAEMSIQLEVLRQEAAISSFVENSVRATINKKPAPLNYDLQDEFDEFDE